MGYSYNYTFDYPHTCPKIDKIIEEVRRIIFDELSDDIFQKSFVENIIDKVDYEMEKYRDISSDMRKNAEYQIEELGSKTEYLEGEVDVLKHFEIEVSELEEQNEYLHIEIENLERELENAYNTIENLKIENEKLQLIELSNNEY